MHSADGHNAGDHAARSGSLEDWLGRTERSEELSKYTTDELIADLRRQAGMRNATWPCVLLRDLLPLCDEIERLKDNAASLRTQRDYLMAAARRTLEESGHLADGDNCTLLVLKRAVETLEEVGAGGTATELHNANVTGLAPSQETTK